MQRTNLKDPETRGMMLLESWEATARYLKKRCFLHSPLAAPDSLFTLLYLHNPDNHDGVITHLEPDILECEVKWALQRITTNKASGGDGIPVKLFQILKDDAVKVLHSICQQIWKTQQWPQDRKDQFSFQSQRRAMPKNAQTTTQLHSSHTPVK